MGLEDILGKMIDDALAEERYGNRSIADVLDMIDSEIGFGMDEQGHRTTLPVIEGQQPNYKHEAPEVSQVEMNGDHYMIARPSQRDFEYFSEDSVKIMRARFLLLRDYYMRVFHTLPHSMKQQVAGGVLRNTAIPAKDSPLAKLMGMAGTDD